MSRAAILGFAWPVFLLYRQHKNDIKIIESNSDTKVLCNLIENTGRYHYHIEYNHRWTNHVMHALIAQYQLGANDEHLKKVAKVHIDSGLEPARLTEKKLIITENTWKNYLGKNEYFIELAEFFDHEYHIRFNGDKYRLLHEYLPQLIDGMSGALTHGIIHLGFALKSPSSQSISDALAYMVYSYRSLGHFETSSSKKHNSIDPSEGCREFIELLTFIRQDILSFMKENKIKTNEKSLLDLVRNDDKYQSRLQSYAKRITTIERVKDEQLHELAHSLCLGFLLVYASTINIPDNFYLLHTVTSGWALRECLKYFTKEQAEFIRRALYDYIITVLNIYLTQTIPEIRLKDNLLPKFNNNSNKIDDLPNWNEINMKAIASMDEHLTKLVFICYDDERYYGVPNPNIYRLAAARKVGLIKWED